jgi:catechol 2,3-dioxygenase-like lactoylglutathione lyase family enzyme
MSDLHLERIDHFVMATTNLAPAYAALTRLGIVATPPGPAADTANDNCFFNFGGPERFVAVEYITLRDREVAVADPSQNDLVALVDAGGGAYFVGFAVESLEAARDAFGATGGFVETAVHVLDGVEIKLLRPHGTATIGCSILLLEYPPEILAVQGEHASTVHNFPLQRLDHLAIIPTDFDASTRYWTDVLGVPLRGEIEAPGIVIRQLQVGDVVVELLHPTSDAGPLAATPSGLLQMIACEVDDVTACAALARERGFTASDPAPGVLPGTSLSRIPPDELAGLSLQLLEYV